MLTPRKQLNNRISDIRNEIAVNNTKLNKLYDDLLKDYNIPINVSFDLIVSDKDLSSFSDYLLFCVLSSAHKSDLSLFFTDEEISFYSKQKYENKENEIKFPIVFEDMVEIANDQWIGRITAKQIMNLSRNRLINYNENTQRTLKKVVKGDTITYAISLNKTNVKGIKDTMEKGIYIPTPITLNVPDDTNFSYSKQKHRITISSIDHFDILDGYHRYVAMSQIYNCNNDFDYTMEFRLVFFSETKAQHFIYQQNQKSKMKRLDANSMNMNRSSNIATKRINDNVRLSSSDLIGINNSVIPIGEFTLALDYFYFSSVKKANENAESSRIIKEVSGKLKELFNNNLSLGNSKWTAQRTIITLFVFSRMDAHIDETIEYLINATHDEKEKFNLNTGRSIKTVGNLLSVLLESRG